ncbi:ribonuclease H-like domain-containing protein [Scenedesmus sp. NREL 46B-D3]|nr:ribonuclease H-like domain-containing protein [Scenedesmus sp. NREL 46B-D3]
MPFHKLAQHSIMLPLRLPAGLLPVQPVCLLLALHTLGLGRGIAAVLRHPHILKVGIGIAHDMMDLLRSHEADCRVPGMLDLSWLATQCGVIKDASPQDAARQQQMQAAGIKTFQQPLQWGLAGLLQRTSQFSLLKNKRITMSNWSKIPLSEQQLQYAACDAYADAAFWRSYTPAVDRQQQWQQLLQRGTTAAQLQYDNMIANALDKAVAEDGSDFDRAVPGTPVADAGADAAAAGLLWP